MSIFLLHRKRKLSTPAGEESGPASSVRPWGLWTDVPQTVPSPPHRPHPDTRYTHPKQSISVTNGWVGSSFFFFEHHLADTFTRTAR